MISKSNKTRNKHAIKTSKVPQKSFLFFEKVFNIFRIIILVDKCTKNTRIICHCMKRFYLILIVNHFENGDLIAILNHIFGK
jgi:hypothetical protein